ncbi:MAG TPA: 3-hydroxyacyl-ACP dehydratase FabZ [Rhizobiaceae bacterium]|nr:3-hydroxyacyl-ACP dehydratase FabZ [Rhizobiaceae bacterium]
MTNVTELTTLDVQQIMKLLPHRYPFLLVDRIIDIKGDESAIGIKNVTANEPHFTGHFPEVPVMPGVLIIEAMAQTAGAICIAQRQNLKEPPQVFFMTVDSAKFRKPVVPGDQLEIHVRKVKQRGGVFRFVCEAKVEGGKVAEAEVQAMVIYKDEA